MSEKITPYAETQIKGKYLDIMIKPHIDASLEDTEFIITSKYNFRPDLLAYDLYGNADYLFVFQLRNMDIIKDYIFDFKAGVKIIIPPKSSVEEMYYK